MQTRTATYTKVDIRRVVECFHADLSMLVARTGTMTQQWADDVAHDIRVMSEHECVAVVHVQLLDVLWTFGGRAQVRCPRRWKLGSEPPGCQ